MKGGGSMRMSRIGWAWVAAWMLGAGLMAGPAAAQGTVGRTAVGFEAGLPMVLGVDASHRMTPHLRIGLGFGRIGGLTSLRSEARWLLQEEVPLRFVPSLVAGAEQYFLKRDELDATPLGVHAAFAVDYHFASPVSVGVRVGALKTFGSSGAGDVKVFSIRNGYESGTFNLGVRYHF